MIFQKNESKCLSSLFWARGHCLTRSINTLASQHHDMKAIKCVYCPPLRLFCKTISHSGISSYCWLPCPRSHTSAHFSRGSGLAFASGVHRLLCLPELRRLQELQSEQEQPIWVLRSSVRAWKCLELPIGGRALCSPEFSHYKRPDLSLCTWEAWPQHVFRKLQSLGARILKRTRACCLHLICLPERCCDSLKVTSM